MSVSRTEIYKTEMLESVAGIKQIFEKTLDIAENRKNSFSDNRNFEKKMFKVIFKAEISFF